MSLQSCPMGRVTNSIRPGRGCQKQWGIIAGGILDFHGSEGHVVKGMDMCRSHCDQSNQNPRNQTLEKHDSWLHGYNRSLLFDPRVTQSCLVVWAGGSATMSRDNGEALIYLLLHSKEGSGVLFQSRRIVR